ncbi:DUF4198 domain-containing protein [Brevibacillus composti]|uniref:DUF4198 domain-containing protein n=1 Tax=Brevibacillus composti TaxID=2796470 RepID=A0A7T5EID2_9BACL|nr:DUF4198 domain-containing protein [Brevibacillus composti]QQE73176.1 DUF4198 domain-containing protein [Brevibacillus composti]QUO40255.1 DUF4198 domain-containing protein [Brevibacillus composti]
MKKRLTLIPALALACLLALPVSAHDGWSQTHSPIIAAGEVSYVELLLGNHSNHHASYRIEGRWSTDTTKVYVISPNGSKADITATLFYTGEEQEVAEPGKNNYFVASFSSSQPGAYIVSAEGDSIFKQGETASRTLRSAKSFVAVSDIPMLQRVAGLKGFSQPVSTDRAELIPQFNPAAVTPGQEVSVQLLLKGQPLKDTEISVIRRSTSDAAVYKTDEQGRITFTTGPADYYLLRAKPKTDEKAAGQYDTTNYEATMTFTVQNGKFTLPAAADEQTPFVYLNGKQIEVPGLSITDGKTMVPAEFVKTNLNPAFTGSGQVELQKAAAEAGAATEWLAPVGSFPAAIAISKK